MRILLSGVIALLPWTIKRRLLMRFFGFDLDRSARIGISLVMPRCLAMGPGARIGHFSVIKGLSEVRLGACSRIGNLNWISGFPLSTSSAHFADQHDRRPVLQIGEHSAITNRHIVDCTDCVSIGCFSTFAGFRSQVLTHSIDIENCRQRATPVKIGDYCFVGTGCILLGGSVLPDYSVLAAGSVLAKGFETKLTLYAGVPAKAVKELSADLGYFCRKSGFVV